MGTANPKPKIDKNTKKKKQPKHNTTDGRQTTREENKRGREEKRPTKTKDISKIYRLGIAKYRK